MEYTVKLVGAALLSQRERTNAVEQLGLLATHNVCTTSEGYLYADVRATDALAAIALASAYGLDITFLA